MAMRHDRAALRRRHGVAAIAGLLLACTPAVPARAEAAPCSRLEAVAWLLGTWRAESRDTLIAETWAAVSDTTFEGRRVTRSRSDGSIRDAEDLRLVAMGDGVFYLAKVAHDFPRRIEYRRMDEARFEAHVSDGASRGFRLEFSRSAAD